LCRFPLSCMDAASAALRSLACYIFEYEISTIVLTPNRKHQRHGL
jgi:hypothetical protein